MTQGRGVFPGRSGIPGSGAPGRRQALQSATERFQNGRLSDAHSILRDLLARDPQDADALHLLGAVLFQSGNAAEAERLFRHAIAINGGNAEFHASLGAALLTLGRPGEGEAALRQALTLKPSHPMGNYNLGLLRLQNNGHEEAIRLFNKALKGDPQNLGALNALGVAHRRGGDLPKAVHAFQKVLLANPGHVQARLNLASTFVEQGQPEKALAEYETLQPALANDPQFHFNRAVALRNLERLDDAVAGYRRALALRPDHAEAHHNLIKIFERTNRTEDMRDALGAAKRACPGHPLLAVEEAQFLVREGQDAAARAVLETINVQGAPLGFLKERAHLLGRVCDRLNDADAAFFYFTEGNRLYMQSPEAQHFDGKRAQARVDALAKRYSADWVAGWRPMEEVNGRSAPVFLVGFPRSGTTLLDTILRSHGAIAVVEEMPILDKVVSALRRGPQEYPDSLATLETAQWDELRTIYFGELDKLLDPSRREALVIDKMPLNLIEAGLIHRLFPDARFIFAQRHPCDCVLSCFMQGFGLNDAMANFLDLRDSAVYYDKVMALWGRYQELLPLRVHTVRYESLIEDFEGTLNPLLGFLGLEWNDDLHRYAETARKRNIINTPSYNQVTQPLYTHARGRWERYRSHLRPVLPLLLPWAERFGYEA